uniref:C2 domain-containing protein n=1 Tax=Macrostomum lignano TaxID=282301 RepID=A0A1I8FMK3_9PLAT
LHFVLQFIPGKATLYIRIIKGECLAAQDSNGLSDPYVKVHLLPDTGKRTKLRTRTCQRTLNPIWDEEFCYSGVLDEDTIGFDWMGEILLPLGHLLHGRKEYYEIPLQPKNFEFHYILSQQELQEKTLEITVWDKDFGTKNDFMGALVIGQSVQAESAGATGR